MQTLPPLDIQWIAIIILGAATLILAILLIRMNLKLKKFLVGMHSENINDSLTFVSGELKDIQKFRKEMENYLTGVEERLRKSVQSVQTVRFNPFKGTGAGGNQSFATAFINQEGDGVLISSLYSRDHVSVFSKPIKNKKSEHELSEEEKEALDAALRGLSS